MITYAKNLNDRYECVAKGQKILLDHNPLITRCLIGKLMVYDDQAVVIPVADTGMADNRGIKIK